MTQQEAEQEFDNAVRHSSIYVTLEINDSTNSTLTIDGSFITFEELETIYLAFKKYRDETK